MAPPDRIQRLVGSAAGGASLPATCPGSSSPPSPSNAATSSSGASAGRARATIRRKTGTTGNAIRATATPIRASRARPRVREPASPSRPGVVDTAAGVAGACGRGSNDVVRTVREIEGVFMANLRGVVVVSLAFYLGSGGRRPDLTAKWEFLGRGG